MENSKFERLKNKTEIICANIQYYCNNYLLQSMP